jgi:hypothetical protein
MIFKDIAFHPGAEYLEREFWCGSRSLCGPWLDYA